VPPRLFTSRNFTLMTALGFLLGFALFGAVNFVPLYQQLVQDLSATASGLALLPMLLATAIVSIVVGQAMSRTGRYKAFPVVGGLIMVVGAVLLALLTADTPPALTAVYLTVLGVGMGFLTQTTTVISQNSVEPADLGVATGTATLVRAIGGLVGVALAGTIFSTRLVDDLSGRIGAQEAERIAGSVGASTVGPESIGALPAPVQRFVVEAFAAATSSVFLWAAVAVALVPVLAALVVEVPLRAREPATDDAASTPRT
jgi:MFS family permease